MKNVVTIYDAKTNLSKLVKQAAAGNTIYMGAYGQPQVILAPLPTKNPVKIGIYADKYQPGDFDDDDVVGSDPEIIKIYNDSINKPFPS